MTLVRLAALSAVCAVVLAFGGANAHALTCKRHIDFASKVKSSPVVLFGKLVKIHKKKYTVEVIKVLKGKKLATKPSIVFDHSMPRMGGGWGFAPRKGQLILFFLNAHARDWVCTIPILIR